MTKYKQITVVSSAPLTANQTETLMAVAVALNGVRMDLELQEIVDCVIGLYNDGCRYDEIGLAILSASAGEPGMH